MHRLRTDRLPLIRAELEESRAAEAKLTEQVNELEADVENMRVHETERDKAQDEARAAGVRTCMAEAQTCPDACRARFAARTQGAGFARVEQIFFEDFVDPGGWCVPREADQ